MDSKLIKIQNKTVTLIQHCTLRLNELNNILAIIDSMSRYPIDKKEYSKTIEWLERRVETMQRRPGYAGRHEIHKFPL